MLLRQAAGLEITIKPRPFEKNQAHIFNDQPDMYHMFPPDAQT